MLASYFMRIAFLATVFSLLISGCSGVPELTEYKYQPIFKFSQVKSYGLYGRNDEFNDWQALSDGVRNGIELAIEQSMDSQGFTLETAEQADVIVTYYLLHKGRKNSGRAMKQYNHGVNYCSYCLTNTKTGTRAERLEIKPGA